MISNEDERALLLAQLRGQRRHALGMVDGLDEATLRGPGLPSGWTFVGMIRHLTLDEERFWFRAVVAGDPEAIAFFATDPDTWDVTDDEDPRQVIDDYRAEIERADEIIGGTDLDAPPAWWPAELFGDWRLDNVREILLHMITEVACHAGHLDAARELVDGQQWLVLDAGRATIEEPSAGDPGSGDPAATPTPGRPRGLAVGGR